MPKIITADTQYNSTTSSVVSLLIQQFYKHHSLVNNNKQQQIMISLFINDLFGSANTNRSATGLGLNCCT